MKIRTICVLFDNQNKKYDDFRDERFGRLRIKRRRTVVWNFTHVDQYYASERNRSIDGNGYTSRPTARMRARALLF